MLARLPGEVGDAAVHQKGVSEQGDELTFERTEAEMRLEHGDVWGAAE